MTQAKGAKTGNGNVDQWNGWNDVAPWAFTGGAGLLGRLMYHARQVQEGKRKPISWLLFWDIPIALGMGWFMLGICVWAGAILPFAISMAIAGGHLGTWLIDRGMTLLAKKYFGPIK